VPKERNLGKREEISVQNLIIEFKKWQKKVYERYYLGLIVKRHHELNHFAYKVGFFIYLSVSEISPV
jgi:hypothetical protein